jgi:hypothetical protein
LLDIAEELPPTETALVISPEVVASSGGPQCSEWARQLWKLLFQSQKNKDFPTKYRYEIN